jgi:leucine dehydrogenase
MANNLQKQLISIFKEMEKYGHEQLIFNYDKATGLKAIIGIHDTTVGPALGGCRMWNYETEQDAIIDVLRLSRGMTYKCAAAGVSNGGGKCVIFGDPRKDKSDEYFQALGTFVETLKGRFWTGTDVGTVGMDFVSAAKQTKYLNGLPEEYGGSGNSAVTTAYGVYNAMKAVAKELYGTDSLAGKTVAIQGLGKVGKLLVKYLVDDGAKKIYATDIFEDSINQVKAEYPQVQIVKPEEIYGVDCDIYSPCALGAVVNDDTIKQFKCKGIVGAANNVLAEERHGDMLHEMGILYAPDYVANAGGLIQVADEFNVFNKDRVLKNTSVIYDTMLKIFAISKEQNIATYKAADRLVEERLEKIGGLRRKYTGRQ